MASVTAKTTNAYEKARPMIAAPLSNSSNGFSNV
jgi:hypothetical protein